MVLVISIVSATILVSFWRVLDWVWLRPKKLERCLRQQGLDGNPYRFLYGDTIENSEMIRRARSKPISLSDDIASYVTPFLCQTVKNYGKNSFAWFGPRPRVTLMNPGLIKDVLTKIYDFRKPNTNPLTRVLVTGLVNHEEEKWAKHRRIINPAFHLKKLENMVPAFHQSCSEMISKWEEMVSNEGWCELDVWPCLVNLTSDVISRAAFGSSYEEGKRIFHLIDQLRYLTQQLIQSVYIPGWRFLPTKLNKKLKACDTEIRCSLKGVINKREKAMKAGEVDNDDLLGTLMEANSREIQENGGGTGMSLTDVMDECKIFYFAGQETTSVLLVWTMVLLAHHPIWQSRAREEVLRVFGHNKPDFNGLNRLKIVTMILYEVLRLYPPAVQLIRLVGKETKLGNLVLPAGVEISIPIILIHRDPELWGDDAGEFKPERFAEGVSMATKNQSSFLPFSSGPRICIGQNFAMMEAKIALAMILQHFEFELSSTYTHSPVLVLTAHPQYGANMILRKL